MRPQDHLKTMGTWPVFLTAISTILGAILFLRFGYAVAHVGLVSTLMIVALGHMVTLPTALAVAEIATNQKVEGGGAYYMISRSFGLNIGGAIGLALYLSQAISVAFYVIAFTVACRDLLAWADIHHGLSIDPIGLNVLVMALLTLLMVGKGANLGVKALYVVVVLLFVALALFFAGSGPGNPVLDPTATIPTTLRLADGTMLERYTFFEVFTFIFPAFTGIAAGLGLSGDLKDPRRSIPKGTIWATVMGIVIYVAVAVKLWWSAPLESLAADELYMENIALWGPIIPIGLAAAAMSSALGSVMVAPRTLQAIAADGLFPPGVSSWLSHGRGRAKEPVRASVATCAIAFGFVLLGDINAVAEIISMFFMVTYGAICLVSFLEHMAADPSYRPTFRSHWSISLTGAILCVVLMFGMNPTYAATSLAIMVGIHWWVSRIGGGKRGMARLFRGVIFQVQRALQLALQMSDDDDLEESAGWRPFVLSISQDTFMRREGFDMVKWIAYRHGFGTYMHFVQGFLSAETQGLAKQAQADLIKRARGNRSRVHLDTIISPSYTSAIAQCIQLPGISGKGNNLFLMEYAPEHPTNRDQLIDNFELLCAAGLDLALLRSSGRTFGNKHDIHLWITPADALQSNLMVLLAYILQGHPEWSEARISVFFLHDGEHADAEESLRTSIREGRLPIAEQNIEHIRHEMSSVQTIKHKSGGADLVILGFNPADLQSMKEDAFERFAGLGEVLFVHGLKPIDIQ